MAGRNIVLTTGEYYHIFNRGIARQPIFFTKRDYERFLLTLSYYRFADIPVKLSRFLHLQKDTRVSLLKDLNENKKTIVDVLCYALMPNHFHILLRQSADKGITRFMSKVINSYTRYVNTKRERVGDLLQGVFKAVHIETDEQLIHLSRYIHLNPLVSLVVEQDSFLSYPWSSLKDYLTGISSFAETELILAHFESSRAYKQFILDRADYGRRLEEIKHLVIE